MSNPEEKPAAPREPEAAAKPSGPEGGEAPEAPTGPEKEGAEIVEAAAPAEEPRDLEDIEPEPVRPPAPGEEGASPAAPLDEPPAPAAPAPEPALPVDLAEYDIPESVPWEDPDLHRLTAFLYTLRELLVWPGYFFSNLPRQGWAAALAFGLITGTIGLLSSLYWHLFVCLWVGRLLAGVGEMSQFLTGGTGLLITLMILTPLIVLVNLGLGSLCLWVGVALLSDDREGFIPIWRVNCYAQGPMVLGLVPFIGGVAGSIWGLVLIYKGLRPVLGLSGGQSLGALLIALALEGLMVLVFLGSLVGGTLLFFG